jgi:hypothetical protein
MNEFQLEFLVIEYAVDVANASRNALSFLLLSNRLERNPILGIVNV